LTQCVALLDGCSPGSPVQPVTVALRHFSLGVDPTAAYWDFDLLDGHGGWRAEGCQITGSAHNTTTIHCAHHNNLAVLMVRVSRPESVEERVCVWVHKCKFHFCKGKWCEVRCRCGCT